MIKVLLVFFSVISMLFIPGLIYWWNKWNITDGAVMINAIIPIFILMVLCIALHKIISILEEIRDREKKAKTQN